MELAVMFPAGDISYADGGALAPMSMPNRPIQPVAKQEAHVKKVGEGVNWVFNFVMHFLTLLSLVL